MIAGKAYLIGPARRVSSNVTVTGRLWRQLAHGARLQAIRRPPGTACQPIGFVLSYAPILFDRDRLNKELTDRAFAIRIAEYLQSRAQADSDGLKWIQAENRIEPDNVQAQTGLMQGAAGIGLYFIHLGELDGNAETANRFPDSPW